MRTGIRGVIGSWMGAARGIGFLLLLVTGSAVLGIMIAWPLWLFATRESRIYTALVLALAAAGIIFLIVRAAIRRRNEPHDPGKPLRTPLSLLLSFLIVFITCCGAYAVSVFIYQGLWTFALLAVPLWACILWLLGRGRRAFKRRASKDRKVQLGPAENKGE